MDSFLFLALLIFCTAFLVIFSQEFAGIIKKVLSVPGFTLLLPLILVSLVVSYFDTWITWLLFFLKQGLELTKESLANHLPQNYYPQYAAPLLLLLGVSLIPLALLQWVAWRRNGYRPWPFMYPMVTALWLILLILLLVQ